MLLRRSAKTSVFKAIALAQKHQLGLSASDLEVHYLAGGRPLKVIEVLVLHKNEPHIDFNTLRNADLQGEDLESFIKQGSGPVAIDLFKLPMATYYVDVRADLVAMQPHKPNESEIKEIEAGVKRKLALSANQLQGLSYLETQKRLEEEVLNADFWQRQGLQLKSQMIRLRAADS